MLLLLEHAIKKGDADQLQEAAREVRWLGAIAASLLPVLVAALKGPGRSAEVVRAIGSMGTAAAGARASLLETLDAPDYSVVAAAVNGLREIGQLEPKAYKRLECLLDHENREVRLEAIRTLLGQGGPATDLARERLLSAVQSNDPDERGYALKMLPWLPLSVVRHLFGQIAKPGNLLPRSSFEIDFRLNECIVQTAGGLWALSGLVDCASNFNNGKLSLEAFGQQVKQILGAIESH